MGVRGWVRGDACEGVKFLHPQHWSFSWQPLTVINSYNQIWLASVQHCMYM